MPDSLLEATPDGSDGQIDGGGTDGDAFGGVTGAMADSSLRSKIFP